MIRAIAFLFITLVAGSAEAAVVTVKSGEHPDFSRLVLFLPRGADWQLEEAERAVTISLPDGAPHRFDLSGVFDLIPRDRIADLSQADGNRLRVVLNCACPVTASFEAPRYLILDVGDPAEVGDPAAPGPVPTPPPASGSSPELEARLRAELTEGQVSSSRSVTRMAEALAERATRNILEIGDPGPPRTGSEPAPEVVLRNADLPNLALPEIDAENSAGSASHRSPARCDGPVKAPLGRFDGEVDFFNEKAALSARLYTEQLSLDPTVAVELAQLYLSRGLGAEARQILDMIEPQAPPGPDTPRGFLSRLAGLIEARGEGPRDHYEPYRDCAEINAIWPVLAAPRRPMASEDGWRVARAANSLPPPLLRTISPRLIANLIASGQTEPAEMISRTLDRSGGPAGKTMADVLLAEAPEEQQAILTEIAGSNRAGAAEASAMLAEQQIAAGDVVPLALSELVASHADEQRHSATGTLLRKAEALSLISQGKFAEALDILTGARLPEEAQAIVNARFFQALAESADELTFLRHVLAQPGLAAVAPPEVRRALARRLYANRVSEPAARLLEGVEPLDGPLLAEALDARYFGEVGIAEALLLEAPVGADPALSEARYHALLAAGRFAEARQLAGGLDIADPIAPLLALAAPAEANGASAEVPGLAEAGALTEATADLVSTVAAVLADPDLRLDP